jgi:hypothetical protein
MDLNSIIIDIFTGKKPDITFDIFLTKISKYTNTLSWKEKQINDKHLYLFFHDWNAKNNIPESNNNSQHFITKYFNNLIIDTDFNIIMYNGPKIYDSIRDKFNLTDIIQLTENKIDECIINEATEGTNINVFYYIDQWFFTTKRTYNMFDSIYGSLNSHGLMFNNIIDINDLIQLLNKDHNYQFTLVHKDNNHLSTITENKLILTSIRDKSNNFKIINEIINDTRIVNPNNATIDSLKEQDANKQGIIIHYKDYIFRVYNDIYAELLKKKPYYGTIQEKMFHMYQKNELLETNDKLFTIASFNYVAIILYRLLNHFTDFNIDDPKLKFKHINKEDYNIIKQYGVIVRNINKLQRIPFIIKNTTNVDFNQVKFHLKNHCLAKEINMMFKIFKNEDILKCIKYNPSKNIQTNDNIKAFTDMKF